MYCSDINSEHLLPGGMKELVTRKGSHIMISVICVYNDRDILNRFLLRNLRESSDEYELILLDNTGGAGSDQRLRLSIMVR